MIDEWLEQFFEGCVFEWLYYLLHGGVVVLSRGVELSCTVWGDGLVECVGGSWCYCGPSDGSFLFVGVVEVVLKAGQSCFRWIGYQFLLLVGLEL